MNDSEIHDQLRELFNDAKQQLSSAPWGEPGSPFGSRKKALARLMRNLARTETDWLIDLAGEK